jgi:hypothetical protein
MHYLSRCSDHTDSGVENNYSIGKGGCAGEITARIVRLDNSVARCYIKTTPVTVVY